MRTLVFVLMCAVMVLLLFVLFTLLIKGGAYEAILQLIGDLGEAWRGE